MNQKLIAALMLTATLPLGSLAQAESFTDTARVQNVEPMYDRVNSQQEECWNETVNRPRVRHDRYNDQYESNNGNYNNGHNTTGVIIGGVTGAVIGNQVGKGKGKTAATALGAVIGAMVGDRWNENSNTTQYHTRYEDQDNNRYEDSRVVRRCRPVDRWENRVTGYRVTYEYNGRRFTTTMPNHPGREVRVRVNLDPQ